jgi:hypothetical protein
MPKHFIVLESDQLLEIFSRVIIFLQALHSTMTLEQFRSKQLLSVLEAQVQNKAANLESLWSLSFPLPKVLLTAKFRRNLRRSKGLPFCPAALKGHSCRSKREISHGL